MVDYRASLDSTGESIPRGRRNWLNDGDRLTTRERDRWHTEGPRAGGPLGELDRENLPATVLVRVLGHTIELYARSRISDSKKGFA